MSHKASYFKAIPDREEVQCLLCPQGCKIRPGETGICGVRENQSGDLFALNYGATAAMALDPIEKKPLYHFLPGSKNSLTGSSWMQLILQFLPELAAFAGGYIWESKDDTS